MKHISDVLLDVVQVSNAQVEVPDVAPCSVTSWLVYRTFFNQSYLVSAIY